jgi:CubicO group peptidase (beta-lactamase class C family)
MTAEIHGKTATGFEGVRAAFEANFATGGEIGAGVCVYVDGEVVADLWGGHADPARTRAWDGNTLVNVYSTTKGMTALCAQQLIDAEQLDLDRPVAAYWPEFAAKGKQDIPVRWLLSHRAGLAAVREMLPGPALYDWTAMCEALAAEEPWWKPGEHHGYHALTFGWLVGELVRRIDGRSLGTYFREEIAQPLSVDFHIGLPDALHGRVGELSGFSPPDASVTPEELRLVKAAIADPNGLSARAFANPAPQPGGANLPEWRRAEIPGANGHATASGVARVYAALACGGSLDGVTVLSPEGIDRCREVQSTGMDRVLHLETRFGQGFMLGQDRPFAGFGPNPRSFGHSGAGGSLGFADPEAGIGFGYVMNKLGPHLLLDPRAIALLEAVYAAL